METPYFKYEKKKNNTHFTYDELLMPQCYCYVYLCMSHNLALKLNITLMKSTSLRYLQINNIYIYHWNYKTHTN